MTKKDDRDRLITTILVILMLVLVAQYAVIKERQMKRAVENAYNRGYNDALDESESDDYDYFKT